MMPESIKIQTGREIQTDIEVGDALFDGRWLQAVVAVLHAGLHRVVEEGAQHDVSTSVCGLESVALNNFNAEPGD